METERKPIILIDSFPEDLRFKCSKCSVRDTNYLSQIPIFQCGLAILEKNMGRIPTVGEAEQNGINLENIQNNCPNGYLHLQDIPLSKG